MANPVRGSNPFSKLGKEKKKDTRYSSKDKGELRRNEIVRKTAKSGGPLDASKMYPSRSKQGKMKK
jgi:hypothetical protein